MSELDFKHAGEEVSLTLDGVSALAQLASLFTTPTKETQQPSPVTALPTETEASPTTNQPSNQTTNQSIDLRTESNGDSDDDSDGDRDGEVEEVTDYASLEKLKALNAARGAVRVLSFWFCRWRRKTPAKHAAAPSACPQQDRRPNKDTDVAT